MPSDAEDSDPEFFDACSDISSDEDPIDEPVKQTSERRSLDVAAPTDPTLASPPELMAPLSSMDSNHMLQVLVDQAKAAPQDQVTTENGPTTATTPADPPVAASDATEASANPIAPPRRKKKKASVDLSAGASAAAAAATPAAAAASAAEAKPAPASTQPDSPSKKKPAPIRRLPSTPKQNSQSEVAATPATPTDEEILSSVMIKCLDTGETMPLAHAEQKLPKGLNPLALQVMQRTKEFNTQGEAGGLAGVHVDDEGGGGDKKKRLKQFFNKARDKMRSVAEGVNKEIMGDRKDAKIKAAPSFAATLRQDLSREHMGAIWTMKFSACGRLLATAGQDQVVRVWVVKEAYGSFLKLRAEHDQPTSRPTSGSFPAASWREPVEDDVFLPTPFAEYFGHTSDVLDLSWSSLENNYFLLSSSMDKTVRLWHIARTECLACFLHEDFVTAIAFHPRNDKFFLSGSLDSKLRLWNIPEKKVALWNQVGGGVDGSNLITSASFCRGGKMAIAGTYDGRCVFFNTEERLKYHTQIHVKSTRGRNSKGRKISGIEYIPDGDKILVTSNDSRVRLFDLKDLSLSCKYKGCRNNSSQITASFSHDSKFVVCGSEDNDVYLWDIEPKQIANSRRWRRDRNDEFQSLPGHSAVVTVARFAPKTFAKSGSLALQSAGGGAQRYLLVSADYSGSINVHIIHQ